MIFTSVTRALMVSLGKFSTVSTKLRKSATDVFAQKKLSKDIFFISKFVIDTIN